MLIFLTLASSAQKLEKVWSISSGLITPESVLYDPEMDMLYLTNMGTQLDLKTSDGFISLLNPNGSVENLKWICGLNDPKGMAIYKDKLFVADLNELVILSIEHASIIKKIQPIKAKYLNDVTVTSNGIVFVSDMKDQCIYALIDGEFTVWLSDIRLDNVNGLWAEDNKLYAGNSSIWEIDIDTKEMKEIVQGTGAVDGLEKISSDVFIFSNWIGKIFVTTGNIVFPLLDSSAEKINTADLDYLPDNKTIIVPTFSGNSLDCYRLILD